MGQEGKKKFKKQQQRIRALEKINGNFSDCIMDNTL